MNFESFRAARWLRTINLFLQAVLFVTLFGGLNYVALNHNWRYDLTQHRRYSLAPETLAYLSELKRPVRIIVTTTTDTENLELKGLLREYAYATEANPVGKITAETLDVYKQRREADQLEIDQPNLIVVRCGERQRALTLNELYQIEKGERKAFKGEQVLTGAILEVSRPTPKKIYFLTGHGELRIDDVDLNRGMSLLREQLRARNFELGAVDISTARRVPDDADLVIAVAPQNVEPYVQEQLRQYLAARAGRLILLLTPGQNHGLDQLLDDWGVLDDNDLIWDNDPAFMTEEGDLLVTAFAPHPITQSLISSGDLALRIGLARSVRASPGRPIGGGLNVSTIAASSVSAWGERSYRSEHPPRYTPGVDLKGLPKLEPANRLGIVVASERVGARGNLDFSVPRGRLVVFGTRDIITNNRLSTPGNFTIFLNSINWTVDRDTQLKIPARPIERFQLSLSGQQMLRLRYALLLFLPGAAALLGLAVYWSRRT